MRFILDTNIVIPVEPTSEADVEDDTPVVAELLASLSKGNHAWLLHPGTFRDVDRDQDLRRQTLRRQLLAKYQVLTEPPPLSPRVCDTFPRPEPNSNDEIDLLILSALEADCADYVVTNDQRMRKRAFRIGLGPRVLSASEALAAVRALFPSVPIPPPLVKASMAHALRDSDPIFDSLRVDYDPGFTLWLRKCKREQRQVWTIEQQGSYAGVCIINEQEVPEYGLQGRVLKLCTFKISELHRGFRYGELLLKAAFDYLVRNQFDATFVEVMPKHMELLTLLSEFGFVERGSTPKGEVVMAKAMQPDQDGGTLDPLAYNVAFGPHHLKVNGVQAYIVPIKPRYHAMLFPEAEAQLSLVASSRRFGNSIRKAYLCHSNIRRLGPGDLLLFYRSVDARSVRVIGVVEDTLVRTHLINDEV